MDRMANRSVVVSGACNMSDILEVPVVRVAGDTSIIF
jgi:hypothetical protein